MGDDMSRRKVNKKRRIALIKIVVILACLFLVAGTALYFVGRLIRKPEIVNVSKVENTIESYNYILNDNSSDYYKEEFETLKEMLNSETWDKLEEAKLIAKLYTIDLLSLNNKINKYEVTSSQYFYPSKQDMHTSKVIDTFYNLLEDNAYDDRKQKLPEVSNVSVSNTLEDTYILDEEEYPCVVVDLDITYREDLGYPTTAKVILILDNDKYYVVSFE